MGDKKKTKKTQNPTRKKQDKKPHYIQGHLVQQQTALNTLVAVGGHHCIRLQ